MPALERFSIFISILCLLSTVLPCLADSSGGSQRLLFEPPSSSCVRFVDYTECPDRRDMCDTLVPLCDANYDIARSLLGFAPQESTEKLEIVLHAKPGASWANGYHMDVSAEDIARHPEGIGFVIWQMAMGFLQRGQSPKPGCSAPSWLMSGSSDFVRANAVAVPPSDWCAHCDKGQDYKAGYQCTAAFFCYLNQHYSKEKLVPNVIAALRHGEYRDDIWQRLSGKSLDALWNDFSPSMTYRPESDSIVSFVNYTDAPELANFCPLVVKAIDDNYEHARQLLDVPADWQTGKIELYLVKEIKGGLFGITFGHRISLTADMCRNDPKGACGCAVHEMTHVLQNYPNAKPGCINCPFWLLEGFADYMRAHERHVEEVTGWCAKCARNETYKSGYRCAAEFLLFIEHSHSEQKPVEAVNNALIQGTYTDDLIVKLTGSTWDQLWERFAHHLH
jgi:Peptidase of plants and bacteria